MQIGALRCVDRYSRIDSKERPKNIDTIEKRFVEVNNPLEIYESHLEKVQKWRPCSEMAKAMVLLGHAIHQDDDELFNAALLLLKEFETQTGNDLFALSGPEPFESDLPGIFSREEFAARLKDAPLIDLDVLQGSSQLIAQTSKPFTLIESLAIYHRVRELFEFQRGDSSKDPKNRLLLGYAAFYDILDIERCFARDQKKPLDLMAMSAHLLFAFQHLEKGQSVTYPDIHFDYVKGQSLQVDFRPDWTDGYIPSLKLKDGTDPADQNPSPEVLWAYALGTLRGAEYLEAINARAKVLVYGANFVVRDHRDPAYAVDIPTAQSVLNHPSLSGEQVESSLKSAASIEQNDLNPNVYSRPFSFDVSVQKPIQQVLEVGLIDKYARLIPPSPFPPTGLDEWAYILSHLVENHARNGLQIASKTIKKYQNDYPEKKLICLLASNEGNCFALVRRLLTELSYHPESLPGIQALPQLILLAARQSMSLSASDAVERLSPTRPFNEIVTSLQALHEFYADTIPEITRQYFGEGFQLPGRQLKNAARLLERELEKLKWVDSKRMRLHILPSRTHLDAFHPQMGDRNCLMTNPNYLVYSLTDPRFYPHRILVEGEAPENTWRGGIYQVTTVINGQKIMLLSGLDPRLGFHVNPAEFLDGLEKGFGEIAREGGYALVLVHRFEGSSRKGSIQREIDARYAYKGLQFTLSEQDAVGFPLRRPYPGRDPRIDEGAIFHHAHREYYIMLDLRQEPHSLPGATWRHS